MELSKTEAAAAYADGDRRTDYCADFGWYEDGFCDDFCLTPDPDCGVGCGGPNPQGCLDDAACGDGHTCDFSMGASSGCACSDGVWNCTPDVSAGTCVEACEGPNPQGCLDDTTCGEGQVCDLSIGTSSGCSCFDGAWTCTPDLSGGTCVDAS
ncbi:MAG: hypothetical protein AB8I08_10360 [Sandaracinaceae bacterium]